MKKIFKINGMTCAHCQKRVEEALAALDGVRAVKVNLKKKEALLTLDRELGQELLFETVREAGYEPISLEDKKGLFG